MGARQIGSWKELKTSDVVDYQFASLQTSVPDKSINDYSFKSFDKGLQELPQEKKDQIKLEKERATEKNFIVSPIVRHHRGLQAQETEERNQKIEDEIQQRIAKIHEEAFNKGHVEGLEVGRKQMVEMLSTEVQEKLNSLDTLVQETHANHHEVLKQQKMNIYEMIRNLTKWVILRELSDDGKYLHRLLEKLIYEVGTTSNLHIQINKEQFDKMPDVLKETEEKIGKLHNVRVEVGLFVDKHGINIESQNALIKGSLQDQFDNLDKIFQTVGLGGPDDKAGIGN